MSDRDAFISKRVQFALPGMDDVRVVRQVPYAAGADRTLDVYYPPAREEGVELPAVILVSGLRDPGAQRMFGCRISEIGAFVSWARLLAAAGVAAITYTTGDDPAADGECVIRHVERAGATLGIDGGRLGLFAVSSHVPAALGLLMSGFGSLRCAALCYGFMLDLDGSTAVAEAQQTWRFANPAAGRSLEDLPPDVPLFVVRAGRDLFAGVNASIDAFTAHALRLNRPLTLVNHHSAPHAFDLEDDSAVSAHVIRQLLAFLHVHLSVTSEV